MTMLFLKGLIMGVIIALPFGPVGLLCLQRSIYGGVLVGLLSGVGAALADAFYGGMAAFGVRFLSNYLTSHHFILQTVGGIFLLIMGVKMYLDTSAPKPVQASYHKLAGALASIFALALTNPMTVVAFLAIFAGFGLGAADKSTPPRPCRGGGRVHRFHGLVGAHRPRRQPPSRQDHAPHAGFEKGLGSGHIAVRRLGYC